jgi:hypothetical protein
MMTLEATTESYFLWTLQNLHDFNAHGCGRALGSYVHLHVMAQLSTVYLQCKWTKYFWNILA